MTPELILISEQWSQFQGGPYKTYDLIYGQHWWGVHHYLYTDITWALLKYNFLLSFYSLISCLDQKKQGKGRGGENANYRELFFILVFSLFLLIRMTHKFMHVCVCTPHYFYGGERPFIILYIFYFCLYLKHPNKIFHN